MLGLPRYVVHGAGGGGNAPSLNFNFVDGSAFSPQITFTRASTATFFDSAGVLQSAAIDAPRFDYDPATLAARGFLIEEQRTNSIRNNTMVGAVAGTPGTNPTNWDIVVSGSGITREIVGTGTEDGITYIDLRFYGTGSGSATPQIRPETTTQVVSAVGQTWTASYYLRIVGGSTAGITGGGFFSTVWQERDAAGVSLVTFAAGITTPTTAALKTQRVAVTRTLTDAAAVRLTNRINFAFTDGVAVDITLRIGLPQLELGAFATSVIPTTTTALTRSADEAAVNTLSPWYNNTEYTFYWEGSVDVNTDSPVYGGIGGTTFDNTAYLSRVSPNQFLAARSGGVPQVGPLTVNFTPSSGVPFKMASAVKTDDFALCVNGGSVATDTSGVVPASAVRLGIGNAPWTASPTNQKQMWIRRITYYPRRLTDTQLQQITA